MKLELSTSELNRLITRCERQDIDIDYALDFLARIIDLALEMEELPRIWKLRLCIP